MALTEFLDILSFINYIHLNFYNLKIFGSIGIGIGAYCIFNLVSSEFQKKKNETKKNV